MHASLIMLFEGADSMIPQTKDRTFYSEVFCICILSRILMGIYVVLIQDGDGNVIKKTDDR